MARLLVTRLPQAPMTHGHVHPDLFNRFIRVLELNLQSFDPTATYQYTDTTLDQLFFNQGDIIWNLTEGRLQVYDGDRWQTLYAPREKGVGATGQLGSVTVATNGNTSVSIGEVATGYGTEQWYT